MYGLWLLWTAGSNIAAALCCAWAFWRGGLTERLGSLIIVAGFYATTLLKQTHQGPGVAIVVIDVLGLVLFLALALWSRRLWVFFAAAAMVNAVFAHFAQQLAPYGLYAYASAAGLWGGWALLVCLAFGIVGHQLRLKRGTGAVVSRPPAA